MHKVSHLLVVALPSNGGTTIGPSTVAVNPQLDVVCPLVSAYTSLTIDRGSIHALLRLTTPERFRLASGAFFALGLAATTALQATLLGPFLRSLLGPVGAQTLVRIPKLSGWALTFSSRFVDRHTILLTLAFTALIKALLGFLDAMVWAQVRELVAERLRIDFFRSMLLCPYETFEQLSPGVVVARLTQDTGVAAQAATSTIAAILRDGVTVLGLSLAAAISSPKLFIVAALVWPAIALGLRHSARSQRSYSADAMSHRDTLSAWGAALPQSMASLRLLGARGLVTQAFTRASKSYRERELQRAQNAALASPLTELAGSLGLLVALGLSPPIAPHDLDRTVAFFYALLMAYRPLKNVGTLQQTSSAGAQALSALREFQPVEEPQSIAPLALAFDAVSVQRGTRTVAIRQSISISPGTLTAIVGPSGAGKTSILDGLAGLRTIPEPPTYDGNDRGSRELRIAYAPQECPLLPTTLALNLGDTFDRSCAIARMEQVGLGEWFRQLPNGFETTVGPRGITPSVGEQKRLAIVRALLNSAPMVFLDEPTSGLDENTAALVRELIVSLRAEKRTVILVTHDQALAARCDAQIPL